MQATLANPQCTLEPFSSQVSGAQVPAGTVHPQLSLDDSGPHRKMSRQYLSPEGGVTPHGPRRHHILHGSLAQDVRKGTVGQGKGGREVLPRPINTTVEHGSLKTHNWYWVAHSLHVPRHLFKATHTGGFRKTYKPHHFTCFLF